MNRLRARPVTVGYLAGHLPTYLASDFDVVARSIAALQGHAAGLGARVVAEPEPVVDGAGARAATRRLLDQGAELIVLQHASFAMGDVTRAVVALAPRLVLWALAEPRFDGGIPLNGFVSMHLGAGIAALDRPDLAVSWCFGLEDGPWFTGPLAAAVGAARGQGSLRSARIGLAGGIAPSFFPFEVDHQALAARHGCRVESHSLDAVIATAEDLLAHGAADVGITVADMRAGARGRVTTSEDDLAASAAVFLALRRFARGRDLDALAVSDWPEFQDRMGIHPGLAFSWLDETEAVPVACEGDVLGAATMTLLSALSGRGAALLDIATIDPPSGTALLWHCGGSPVHLAGPDGVRWIDHSTLGRNVAGAGMRGVVADLVFEPGPVTVARLDRHGARLFAFEADVVPGPGPGFDGTRGWVGGFRSLTGAPLTLEAVAGAALDLAVDHHVVLTPGHHAAALGQWARGAAVEVVGP